MSTPKGKPPTRADVAVLAKVAPSTVSLILGGRGDSLNIPAETQERVRQAAKQVGYVPNKLIRAVLKGRSGLIGVYLRWEQWAAPYGYWAELMWWLQAAAAENGFQLVPHHARPGISTEEAFASQAGGLVDGVFIFNSGVDGIVQRLLDARLAAVEIGDTYSTLPFVGSDGAHGVRLALEHLKERGYRRPAYLAHESQYQEDQLGRVRAFRDGCAALGFAQWEGMDAAVPGNQPAQPVIEGLPMRADSVICASDEMAYRLLGDCFKVGIRVPEDLAIVGFDAIQVPQRYPVVTSIHTPHKEMTEMAVAKLKAILDGCPYERETVLVPGLRIGHTT